MIGPFSDRVGIMIHELTKLFLMRALLLSVTYIFLLYFSNRLSTLNDISVDIHHTLTQTILELEVTESNAGIWRRKEHRHKKVTRCMKAAGKIQQT